MSDGSSSWKLSGTIASLAARMARSTRAASISGFPSSEKPTAPASSSAFMSTSSFPASPRVIAPTVSTSIFSAAALLANSRTSSGESIAGDVFAMQTTVVKPPAAAQSAPV